MPQNNKTCLMAVACGIVTVMVVVITMSMVYSTEPPRKIIIVQRTVDFPEFKQKFNKLYKTDDEENMRKRIFEKNIENILEHNQAFDNGDETFDLAVNKFADLSNDEFKRQVLQKSSIPVIQFPGNTDVYASKPTSKTPASVDWVKAGKVSPVKNQGQCGSCWSFSAAETIEGAYAIKKKLSKAVSLSNQQLLSCSSTDTGFGNDGCNGGFARNGMHYVLQVSGGIESDKDYPYVGKVASCKASKSKYVTGISEVTAVESGSEDVLQQSVFENGPNSIAIDASSISFQLYNSGVYYNPKCSSKVLNHAVLAAGYGTQGGQEYWLVKNSWGTDWGDDGYIMMARGQGNNCGVATDATFVKI